MRDNQSRCLFKGRKPQNPFMSGTSCLRATGKYCTKWSLCAQCVHIMCEWSRSEFIWINVYNQQLNKNCNLKCCHCLSLNGVTQWWLRPWPTDDEVPQRLCIRSITKTLLLLQLSLKIPTGPSADTLNNLCLTRLRASYTTPFPVSHCSDSSAVSSVRSRFFHTDGGKQRPIIDCCSLLRWR